MRLLSTISRRSLREVIRREIAAGVPQNIIGRRLGLSQCAMSRAMASVDRPTPAWSRIAAYYGYQPGREDHMYVRIPVEQMQEAA